MITPDTLRARLTDEVLHECVRIVLRWWRSKGAELQILDEATEAMRAVLLAALASPDTETR